MATYFVYEWLKQEVCALFRAILVAKFNSFDRYTNQKRRRRGFFSQKKKEKKTYKRKRRQSQRLLWEKFKCPDSPRIKQWLVVNIITVILSFRFTFFKTSLFITFETEFFQRWCLLSLFETNKMQMIVDPNLGQRIECGFYSPNFLIWSMKLSNFDR